MEKTQILTLFGLIVLAGCASAPRHGEQVIARANDLSSRPSWLDETSAMTVQDKNVVFFGQAKIPGSGQLESGYRIAEANAKSHICQNIANKMESQFQHADEGVSGDATQTKFLFNEACSKITVYGAQAGRRYWEKVEVVDNGDSHADYRVFATVQIDKNQLDNLIQSAMNGTKGLSEEFKKQALDKWNEFAGSTAQATVPSSSDRAPASDVKK